MLPDLCFLIISILQSKCVAPAVEISKTVNYSQNNFYSVQSVKLKCPFTSCIFQCIILFFKDPICQPIMEQLMVQVILFNLKLFEVSLLIRNSASVCRACWPFGLRRSVPCALPLAVLSISYRNYASVHEHAVHSALGTVSREHSHYHLTDVLPKLCSVMPILLQPHSALSMVPREPSYQPMFCRNYDPVSRACWSFILRRKAT